MPRNIDRLDKLSTVVRKSRKGQKRSRIEALAAIKPRHGAIPSNGQTNSLVSKQRTVVDNLFFALKGVNTDDKTGASYRDILFCSKTPCTGESALNLGFDDTTAWIQQADYPSVPGDVYPTFAEMQEWYTKSMVVECLMDIELVYESATALTRNKMAVWIDVFNPNSDGVDGVQYGIAGRPGHKNLGEMAENGRSVKLLANLDKTTTIVPHFGTKFANGKHHILPISADGRARFNLKLIPAKYMSNRDPDGTVYAEAATNDMSVVDNNLFNQIGYRRASGEGQYQDETISDRRQDPVVRIHWQPLYDVVTTAEYYEELMLGIKISMKTKWVHWQPEHSDQTTIVA